MTFAQERGIPLEQLVSAIQRGKAKLLEVRERRIHPLRDDKVLTSWNGMMLRSLAEAGAALNRQDYLDAASDNAAFLLGNMRPEGRLLRTFREGQAKLLGYLEDYAFAADGLLALYEATFELRWLEESVELANEMLRLFWDEELGGFYDTGIDHESLVVRPRDIFDNAQPCGGSVATEVLLRLAVITGKEEHQSKAAAPLRAIHQLMARAPGGTGQWLAALDFYLSLPKEIVIVGPRTDSRTQALLEAVFQRYLPNRVVMGAAEGVQNLGAAEASFAATLPLLEQRGLVEGQPTAYVCRHYVCQLPVTDPEALTRQLEA